MYDRALTIDEVLSRLAEQPKSIHALTKGLPRARLHHPPRRDEWSPNDVLAHLRSCGDMWGQYMATIIAEDHPMIRAMSPRTWIKRTSYPELEFAPSFRAFAKQRADLLGAAQAVAKGGLVAQRDGDRWRAVPRIDRVGLRALARQPRAIARNADRAHRRWIHE